nr:hypothetical protein [Streptomyces sp. SID13726]
MALSACSGGGDSDNSDDTSSPSSSASASSSTSGGTASGAAGEVAGSWLATTEGKAVALVVNGDRAALFATGGSVCTGSASTDTIRLKCTDGSKDRADGAVESVDKTTLKVKWTGGLGTETFTRSEGGQLPSGLPTVGLGS